MASIWDFLDSLPKRGDVSPEELAARRQGYADLYQGGLLARNRDQMPLSVQGAQATQDFLPVIGDALALGEAGEALSRGELAAAGLLGTAGIIGLVPGAGDVLAKPVMAAGRRAADIARRIEVDPNAFGSMGGNIRLRPQSSIDDQVAAARKAVLDNPNDPALFDEYKRIRRVRDDSGGLLSSASAPDDVSQVDTSYRMSHQPVGPQDENPIRLDDLTKSITGETAGYPEDFYGSQGMRFYAQPPSFPGDEYGMANQESYRAIRAVRGNPDAEVTIYRGVPDEDSITSINPGDFVTLSPKYAEIHASSGYGPRGEDAGKVISQKVKVRDVFFAGDDVNEFGYFPEQVANSKMGLLD